MFKRIILNLFFWVATAVNAQTEIFLPQTIAGFDAAAPMQVGMSPVSINATGLFAMAKNAEASLTLPDKTPIAVVHDRVEVHPSGNRTWIGYLRDFGTNYRVIITTGAQGSSGRIALPGNEYWVTSQAGQTWLMDRAAAGVIAATSLIDDGIVPSAKALKIAQAKSLTAQSQDIAEALPTPQSTVDVMVVYTPSLVTQLGSGLQARLDQLVAISNQAYIDSEVAITLRLVHAAQVAYSDATDNSTALNELSGFGSSGSVTIPSSLANVATWRNTYGADLVVLMRAYNNATQSSCGVGWIGGYGAGTLTGSDALGYSVVSNGTSGSYYCDDLTFAHEIGHNMGNRHDHRTDPTATSGVFSYSFGHGIDNSFVTVMGYPSSFTNASRVGKFSNPLVLCNSQACGVSNSADNALSMNNIRAQVAAYRTAVKAAQTITFGTAPTVVVGGTGTVSATASSGLAVSFSIAPSSTGICTLSGSTTGPSVTVTGLLAGPCTVAADQAGDANYNAAPQVLQAFSITATAPSAPTNVAVVSGPGSGRVTVSFTPPIATGGASITSYTATCSASGQPARSTTGASSPLVVSELKSGIAYSCSVTAFNGTASSSASTTVSITPKSKDLTPILMLLLD